MKDVQYEHTEKLLEKFPRRPDLLSCGCSESRTQAAKPSESGASTGRFFFTFSNLASLYYPRKCAGCKTRDSPCRSFQIAFIDHEGKGSDAAADNIHSKQQRRYLDVC